MRALFVAGAILCAYGGWCLLFTEAAVDFGRNWLVGDRANVAMTKIQGAVAVVAGLLLCALGI